MKIVVPLLFATVLATGSIVGAQQGASAPGTTETGLAAVYTEALDGHATASGQIYDKSKLTAAHKTLPFGTKVRVTNVKNHRTVDLVINDRGPRQPERILDLSSAAAQKLGIPGSVMRDISFEVLPPK